MIDAAIPSASATTLTAITDRRRHGSIRARLLALTLMPLLGVLPLLGLVLLLWGDRAIDHLLIGKVRSDLAVAQGYFERVQAEVGSGTVAVAGSQRLHRALAETQAAPRAAEALLDAERRRLGFDFLRFESTAGTGRRDPPPAAPGPSADTPRPPGELAQLALLEPADMDALAAGLSARARVALVETRNAAPTTREVEDRGLVLQAVAPVSDARGRALGRLRGGMLLNRNLAFIDHINEIVYPLGSLPFGSQGTATLFLDDVRVTTNVRLFGSDGEQRAIGTRVSQAVRAAVLDRGETWLDRAFVVKDWYVSGYLPLVDAQGRRLGMLYVGYLERPFVLAKYAVLAGIGLVFFAVMILAAGWSLRSARRIFRPLEHMTATLQQVESGAPRARVGPLRGVDDEIGQLGATLDHLLDAIDDKTRALQRWGEELDRKVAERTDELAARTRDLEASHASLQAAQQQLVRSEKLAAIGQLTASIAHEVNNPIAVIQGNLDLVRELLGTAAQPVGAELRLIDEQVERMRLIVTQLLQYSRPNDYAGYVETLDTAELVRASLVLVNHLLVRAGLRVTLALHATRSVAMNRQELQQVLINLLVNAVQSMQAGTPGPATEPGLTVRSLDHPADEAGPARVLIEVLDHGPGLSEDALARLFQPFQTTKRDGHGLGLWISRSLLERYGGELHAANRPATEGGGAVFSVILPVEAPPPGA